MRVSIFGTGYVGLVTGACFAELGNHVICVDINAEKIAQLHAGICPIHEPNLPELIKKNYEAGRLRFTTDAAEAIHHGQCLFIAVGTPSTANGSADLRYIFEVAQTIGQHLTDYRVVINKSTVPVGTADKVKNIIQQELTKRQLPVEFD
jgi:UDPglucose 6-dehydrogenase